MAYTRFVACTAAVLLIAAACAPLEESSEAPAPEAASAEIDIEPSEEPADLEGDDGEVLDLPGLGVHVDDLSEPWNDAVNAYGAGNQIPAQLAANDDGLPGVEMMYLELDDALIFIAWNEASGEVTEVAVDGLVDVEHVAVDLTATAAAMIYATSDRDHADAEDFLVDELMGGIEQHGPEELLIESIEGAGREYGFSWVGNTASWYVTARD